MTQEDKQLALQNLCARLPYGVIGEYSWKGNEPYNRELTGSLFDELKSSWNSTEDSQFFPYLRPLSSMTEGEKKELINHVLGGKGAEFFHVTEDGSIDGNQEAEQELYNLNLYWISFDPLTTSSYIDWLNKKMFDYRGLIPKGLANSTEEFNPYIN